MKFVYVYYLITVINILVLATHQYLCRRRANTPKS